MAGAQVLRHLTFPYDAECFPSVALDGDLGSVLAAAWLATADPIVAPTLPPQSSAWCGCLGGGSSAAAAPPPEADAQEPPPYDARVVRLLAIARARFGAALEAEGMGITLRSYQAGEWTGMATTGGPGWVGTRAPPALVLVNLAEGGKWRAAASVPLFTSSYMAFLSNTGVQYFLPGTPGEAACARAVEAGKCPPPLPTSLAAASSASRPALTLREAGRGDPEQVPSSRAPDEDGDEPRDNDVASPSGVDSRETGEESDANFSWPPSPLLLPPPMPAMLMSIKGPGAPTSASSSSKQRPPSSEGSDPPSTPALDLADGEQGSPLSLSGRSSPQPAAATVVSPARYLRHPLSPLTRLVSSFYGGATATTAATATGSSGGGGTSPRSRGNGGASFRPVSSIFGAGMPRSSPELAAR